MCGVDVSDVILRRRSELDLSQADLADRCGLHPRQIGRYEHGEQVPGLDVAVRLADALDISLARLAGLVSEDLDLSGRWFASWETSKEGMPRVDTQPLEISQQAEQLQVTAERALPVEEGSYAWRGELQLHDNEALIGWYRASDGAVRSKGAIYFALHPQGEHAWGRWVGLSYDGAVVTGWGAMARTEDVASSVVRRLIDTEGESRGRAG